jgi:ABC-type uncharacterized transport system fused permease/ATPase subunit
MSKKNSTGMIVEVNAEDDGYFMEGVAFKAPGRTEELVKDLHLHLKPGKSLLITGSSSAGKTIVYCDYRAAYGDLAEAT